jgi:hypothetical protein
MTAIVKKILVLALGVGLRVPARFLLIFCPHLMPPPSGLGMPVHDFES